MSKENVEIMRRWVALTNGGDDWTSLDFVDPDIECFPGEDDPEAAPFRGGEAMAERIERWHEAYDKYAIEVSEYIDLGDYVAVVAQIHGRGRISQAEVTDHEVWLVRFRDGKAVEYRACRTKDKALEAAGLRE
jgi:ketosteroid isomerase-like protein